MGSIKSTYRLSALALFFTLSASLPASAAIEDYQARECILVAGYVSGGAYNAWTLPGNSGWKILGNLRFNHHGGSDYILSSAIAYAKGSTPDARIEYQFLLDGVAHGHFVRRTDPNFPASQVIRAFVQNVPAGVHTVSVQARNLSNTAVYPNLVWIHPFLLDDAETVTSTWHGNQVTVGSNWSTLAQISVTPPADKMLFIGGYLSMENGTPGQVVEYRLVSGPWSLPFSDTVPSAFPDAEHIAWILRTPLSGTNTVQLQARTPSGLNTTFSIRTLEAQTLPKFTVFEGGGGWSSIPNNDQWHDFPGWASPLEYISPLSVGANRRTWGSGFAYYTLSSANPATEGHIRFDIYDELGKQLEDPGNGLPFSDIDFGQLDQAFGGRRLGGHLSDWGKIGFNDPNLRYQMRIKGIGLCQGGREPNGPANISLEGGRFQMVVIPDNWPYLNFACGSAPTEPCCADYPGQCTYQCYPGNLQGTVRNRLCFF